MGIISLDLGDKRVWIAHENLGLAFPREIIPRVEILQYLKKLEQEYSYETILVGLPYDLYGKNTKQLEKTEKFIKKLQLFFPEKNIIWWDERFSTFEARIDNAKWKYIDDISASLILQSYLQTHTHS